MGQLSLDVEPRTYNRPYACIASSAGRHARSQAVASSSGSFGSDAVTAVAMVPAA